MKRQSDSWFYAFLLGLTVFRILYSGWFELSLDEAYYWLWSKHLDLSYYDHPPMVAYMIAASNLLGETERHVRLFAVLCGSAVTWIVYIIGRDIFLSRRAGFAGAVLLNLTLVFGVGSVTMTPDVPLLLFWALSLYCGYMIVETQEARYWPALGLCFGLAMLSKYNAALFAPAFLLFLAFSVENRHWLFRKEPYLAFALSMIIFSPVVFWNAGRDWTSFRFQLSHGFGSGTAADILKHFGEFWGGQAALYGLFLFFLFVWAAFAIGREGLRSKRDDYLYLSFMSAPLFVFFLLNSLKSRMEGNWSTMAYIAAIAAAPGLVAIVKDRSTVGKARAIAGYYWFAAVFAAGLTVFAHIQIVEPVIPMPYRYEISRRVYGWGQLAAEADRRLADMGPGAFIIGERYQITTLLTFYTEGHRESYITNGGGRFGYLGSVEHLDGENALYVAETGRTDIGKISAHFEKVEPAGSFRIVRMGELIREFSFFKCYNYRGGLIKI